MTGNSSGTSRDEILRRVRGALGRPEGPAAGPAADAAALARDYLSVHAERNARQSADLLADNLADYRAAVHRTDAAGLPGTIARLLTEHGSRRAVVPPGLPPEWLSRVTGVELVPAAREASARELDAVDSVVTGCALAIAETGTIVLDGSPDQGHRRITLVPDHHICVVLAPDQVVDSVPQAMPRLDATRPLTWISGPSATSDIELDRVEGVHGPRTLEVVLVASG
ncbi:lactate utilization protein C [Streptomyces polygonati]|uniref:Lactate utilization protein C n=1 Tax=Streptomyces polygonati TaxID=1617087 RepID=A0ABV8HIN4_9ACTN